MNRNRLTRDCLAVLPADGFRRIEITIHLPNDYPASNSMFLTRSLGSRGIDCEILNGVVTTIITTQWKLTAEAALITCSQR